MEQPANASAVRQDHESDGADKGTFRDSARKRQPSAGAHLSHRPHRRHHLPTWSSIEAESAGETSTVVTWTTDEYVDSTVDYGTRPGAHTVSFSNPLCVKVHTGPLTELAAETTCFCPVSSTDLSGNTDRSEEFSFEQVGESFVYLPLVLR